MKGSTMTAQRRIEIASTIVIVASPAVIIASGELKPSVSPTAAVSAVTSDVCALGMPPAAESCLASTFRVRKYVVATLMSCAIPPAKNAEMNQGWRMISKALRSFQLLMMP